MSIISQRCNSSIWEAKAQECCEFKAILESIVNLGQLEQFQSKTPKPLEHVNVNACIKDGKIVFYSI